MCERRSRNGAALVVSVLAAVVLAGCSGGADTVAGESEGVAPTDAQPTDAPPATEVVPTPEPLPDGAVVAVDGGLSGGLLYIVWDQAKERIAQPAPLDAATIEDLGLRLQPPVDRLAARAQPDPRTFWVVHPPSGPDAALHLAVGRRLYPVQTVRAPAWQVDGLPDATDPLLNRMRPAPVDR